MIAMFLIWDMMRTAALVRHAWVNIIFEDGSADLWPAHVTVVKNFYGY